MLFFLFAIAKEYEAIGNVGEALSYYLKLKNCNPDYVDSTIIWQPFSSNSIKKEMHLNI